MTPEPSPASGPSGSTDRPSAGGPNIAVVPAEAADVDVLSVVIAEAFHPLVPAVWLISDPDARRDIFPGYFRLFVEHALACGVVHTTPDRHSVALWIPVGTGGPAAPAEYAERLAAATGRWVHRFRAFDAAVDARHPVGFPHHHLAMLAVRPGRQGQGTGTALLLTRPSTSRTSPHTWRHLTCAPADFTSARVTPITVHRSGFPVGRGYTRC